jgi:TolA-binding protein
MSKDERWKQLLDLAGVLGSTTSGARANEPMASQMSFLFGGTNLSSAQPRQLTELTQAVSHDSGGLEFEDTDQSRILSDHIVQLSKQIQDLRQTAEKQTLSIENNTVVTQENTSTRAQHGLTSAAAGIGRTLSGIGSGLTLSPLIRGLTHLVKGGTSTGDTSPMPLYIPPAPFRAEGTISRHGDAIDEVSYGQAD